jgi:hypothetical protein
LASTNERDLMKMIRIVHNELESLIDEFDEEYLDTNITYSQRKADEVKTLIIGNATIQQVTFTD